LTEHVVGNKSICQLQHLDYARIPQPIEKPRQYWFYICGFNFAIVAGLFVGFFGWLLGRWRGMLAAFLGIAGMGQAL